MAVAAGCYRRVSELAAARDIPYDLLLRPNHLRYIPELVERCRNCSLVIDHIAKPLIASRHDGPVGDRYGTDRADTANIREALRDDH